MMDTCIKPEPDFDRLRKVLVREALPDRVPFIELGADSCVMEAVLGKPCPSGQGHEAVERMVAYRIAFYHGLGYDYVGMVCGPPFPGTWQTTDDPAAGKRNWLVGPTGEIDTVEDVEAYPWPEITDEVFAPLEYANAHLPDGMKIIAITNGGTLEWVSAVLGYENMCLKLAEDREVVAAIAARAGDLQREAFQVALQYENVGAVWVGDDMGFKTQTLISPNDLRAFVLPQHKQTVDLAHAAGLPIVLHSCGNLEAVMDDLIDGCGYDAKHSFEDAIMPIEQVKDKYGSRIAIVGGMDVGFLTRATPDDVTRRTRDVLDHCMPGGGYGLGTGNSVASYIPVENYIAMLETGWQYGRY